jgi:hypothetical protein
MNYTKNAGYGMQQFLDIKELGSGKIRVVGDASTANRDMLVQLFDGADVDGEVRFYSTIDAAISACTPNAGDNVLVMPGHTETVATAGAIALDVAGVSVIGIGQGADRPTLTFSATAATLTMSAASTSLKNIITTVSVDSVVSPIVVSAADCTIDIEHRDASTTVEAVRAILTTAAADNLDIKLKYVGFTGGNACVNAIRLVGGSQTRINIDFFGVASTSVVEFLTTAVVDCNIEGYMYNSGTTNYSKDVVDTVTGSTWYAVIEDGAAGSVVRGGSADALAAGDLGDIASDVAAVLVDTGTTLPATLTTIDANQDAGVADAVTNALMRDVVGNKTDAAATGAVSATESIVAYAKQLVTEGIARDAVIGTPTAADLSSEFLSLPRCVAKTDGSVDAGDDILFNITGGPIHVLEILGIVTTTIEAGAANVKLQIDTTTPAATVDISAGAVDIDGDVAGTSYETINTTGVFTPVTAGYVKHANSFATNPTDFIAPIGDIVFNSDASKSGVIAWYMRYVPLSPLSRVVAAA